MTRTTPLRRAPFILAGLSLTLGAATARGDLTTIASTGDVAPGTGGLLFHPSPVPVNTFYDRPLINPGGDVLVKGSLKIGVGGVIAEQNNTGIWLYGADGQNHLIVREGDFIPNSVGGDAFGYLYAFQFSDNQKVGIYSNLTVIQNGLEVQQSTIYKTYWVGGINTTPQLVAREGTNMAGTSIPIKRLEFPAMDEQGNVALLASTTSSSLNDVIFAGTPGNMQKIARVGDTIPGTVTAQKPLGDPFSEFPQQLGMSDGRVAFIGRTSSQAFRGVFTGKPGEALNAVSRTAGGVTMSNVLGFHLAGNYIAMNGYSSAEAIMLTNLTNNSSSLIALADSTLTPVPSLAGARYASLGGGRVNRNGQVVFIGLLSSSYGGINGNVDDQVVIAGAPGSLQLLARRGQAAPGMGGLTFLDFEAASSSEYGSSGPTIGDNGNVLITGTTSGNGRGFWLYDLNGNSDLIAAKGHTYDGKTISDVLVHVGSNRETALNASGQIAFRLKFTDATESILLYSPPLLLNNNGGTQSWDSMQWSFNGQPSPNNAMLLSPSANTTLTGPSADTHLKSIELGGGAGAAQLNLKPGVEITTDEGFNIKGNGTLAGVGTIVGDLTNAGTLAPGNSPGAITVEGDYTQLPAGLLEMQIGGASLSLYDRLLVTGEATFDGTLEVAFINGFIPLAGQSFDLFNFASASGAPTLNLPALPQGLSWNTSALLTTGTLGVTGTAIPEPASLMLLATGGTLLLRRRRA